MVPSYNAVVIGTSMGGLNALNRILSPLPTDYCLPIMVVQHQLSDADNFLPEYLNRQSSISIKYPYAGEVIESGVVYIAPPGYHLLVEDNGTLSLSIDLPVNYSLPSIDVLFEAAADVYEERLIGIVLTGASDDGSQGLKAIKERGGLTIVQDPAGAESDVMPKAAIATSHIDHVLHLDEISTLIRSICDD